MIEVTKPTGWVHAVLVYHGVDQGITAYQDGRQIEKSITKGSINRNGGKGKVVIGRRLGGQYASALVDEIKMYNRQLSQEEMTNMYWICDKNVHESKGQFFVMLSLWTLILFSFEMQQQVQSLVR